jgi:DNA-binding NarL/FixJ family response regulator
MLRILLADDHAVVREGLQTLLEAAGWSVVAKAADGRQAVELATKVPADVAVLDISMPGMNGIESGRAMLRVRPLLKCVLLTMHAEEPYVLEALRAGIRGYVLKTQASSDLVEAIQTVVAGKTYLSPGISQAVADAMAAGWEPEPDPLTAREREVLQLVSEGRTTKEVASALGISVKTAETHRTRLMRKLNVHETAGLVRYAIRRGIIEA